MTKNKKRYGKYFTWFCCRTANLVVCDPVAARLIFADSETFVKGPDYRNHFSLIFGDGLVTSLAEKHSKDRKIFGRFFVKGNILKYVGMMNRFANEVEATQIIGPLEKLGPGGKLELDIEEFFSILSLRVFLTFSLSERLSDEYEKDLVHAVKIGSRKVVEMIALSLPAWDIIPHVAWFKRQFAIGWPRYFQPIYDRRVAAVARGEKTEDDVLGAMVANHMSAKEIHDHVITMISAGHDTTAYFGAYFFYLMALYPEAQEKLRAEIIENLGDKKEVLLEDCTDMKYMTKCMMEALRLFAVVPQVSRLCTKDTYIKESGVTIRKGVQVIVPLFILNRDSEMWERPNEFIPERFEGKAENFTSAKQGYFPFGYGTRTCIGNMLSQMESTVFFSILLRKYRVLPAPGFKPELLGGISLTTANGVRVVLQKL